MKKAFLAFILLTGLLIRIYPQSITKESLISELDATRLTSGILYNLFYNYDLYTRFNGVNDTVCSNSHKWMNLYRELYISSVRQTGLIQPTDLYDSIDSIGALNLIPIGIINRKCDSIKLDAFTNNLLVIDDNKLIDGSNTSESPYLTLRCFSGSALIDTAKTSNVKFLFSDLFNIIEPDENIDSLLVDFDDGGGPKKINSNEEKEITYFNTGVKNISIEEYTSNGTYKCMSQLLVQNSIFLRIAPPTELVDPSGPFDKTANYNGQIISGSYKIYFGTNNLTGYIRKPLILVEGFDPNNTNDFTKIYAFGNNQSILDHLRSNNYDIIILNFTNANIKIQANGKLLESIIAEVNAKKVTNEDLVILGASMGGLVARYALAEMEHNNLNHHTRLFASLDTPHMGAYYPMCAQLLVNQLKKSCNSSFFVKDMLYDKLKPIFNQLDCDAARQMLIYHYGTRILTSYGLLKFESDALHDTFFNELNSLTPTGFPQKCKNIALSCGSGTGMPQSGHTVNTSFKYIDYDDIAENADIKITMSSLTGGDPLPNLILYLDATFGQAYTLLGERKFLPYFSDTNLTNISLSYGEYQAYDGASGGNYQLMNKLLGEIKTAIGVDFTYSGSECFIPTSSALNLIGGTNENISARFHFNNYQLEVDNYFPREIGPIYFDAMYVEDNNRPHLTENDSFTEGMHDWLISQITKEDEFLQNKTLSFATKRYEAHKTFSAGNNVTSGDLGNVIIQNNSDIKFVAGEKIYLGPGFEVKLGSKFKAEIKN